MTKTAVIYVNGKKWYATYDTAAYRSSRVKLWFLRTEHEYIGEFKSIAAARRFCEQKK